MKKLIFLLLFFLINFADAQQFDLFGDETEGTSYSNEPKVLNRQDQRIRKISLNDTNLPVARVERGIIFVGPRTRSKYKVVYSRKGQSVRFFDRYHKMWGYKQFNEQPRYLITSPYTKAIQEVSHRPEDGVYKDQDTDSLYLILSKQGRRKFQKQAKSSMLNSDEGFPAKTAYEIGNTVTFSLRNNSKITGIIKNRTVDNISIEVLSKAIKGVTYNKNFNWKEINPKFLEQLMPERYAENMLADGYLKYGNRWLRKNIAEKHKMTDMNLVKYKGSWISQKEYSELTSFIKLPRY